MIKQNKNIVISDGESVTKLTVFEEFASRFKEGQLYLIKGHRLMGKVPPYSISINKNTLFFCSAPAHITEELK